VATAVAPPAAPIGGTVDPRFEAVREAFAENFASRGEHGASVCVVVDGKTVVDLWGGWSDGARRHAWQPDSLVNIFSVGKAVAALCVARLVGQGRMSYEQPVAGIWPEFAAGGKSRITVRQLLSHQAGLPSVRALLPAGTVFDPASMRDALAAHEPWWEPGTAHGYHVNTFGVLVGELVRRVYHDTLGTMVRRDIAGPLGADFHIGVPRDQLHRVAEFTGLAEAPTAVSGEMSEAQLMEWHAYFNPPPNSREPASSTAPAGAWPSCPQPMVMPRPAASLGSTRRSLPAGDWTEPTSWLEARWPTRCANRSTGMTSFCTAPRASASASS
jgi:CubicO group peptidase (beta-lactamase class C family)